MVQPDDKPTGLFTAAANRNSSNQLFLKKDEKDEEGGAGEHATGHQRAEFGRLGEVPLE